MPGSHSTLKIGLIGFGGWATSAYVPALRERDDVETFAQGTSRLSSSKTEASWLDTKADAEPTTDLPNAPRGGFPVQAQAGGQRRHLGRQLRCHRNSCVRGFTGRP